MIIFKNWEITVRGPLGQQFDHLSRRIDVKGDLPDGYDWALLVEIDGHSDIIMLEKTDDGVGVLLTRDQLSISGYYSIQLRGTNGDVVRHTNKTLARVYASLSGDATWPEIPSEFTQAESRILEAADRAEAAAINGPKLSDDGYWMFWNSEKKEYVKSEFRGGISDEQMTKMLKESRPDWSENDPESLNYVSNRTHWVDDDGTVHKLDQKYLDLPEAGIVTANIISVSDYEFVSDVTYEDLLSAHQTGRVIQAQYDGTIFPMIGVTDSEIEFATVYHTGSGDFEFGEIMISHSSVRMGNKPHLLAMKRITNWKYVATAYGVHTCCFVNDRENDPIASDGVQILSPAFVIFGERSYMNVHITIIDSNGHTFTSTLYLSSGKIDDLTHKSKPSHMRVTFTYSEEEDGAPIFSADKTFDEISAHHLSGGSISGIINLGSMAFETSFRGFDYENEILAFSATLEDSDENMIIMLIITSDNSISVESFVQGPYASIDHEHPPEVSDEERARWGKQEISVRSSVIGTTWVTDATTGVKTQIVRVDGVSSSDTCQVDCVYCGNYSAESYSTFAEQKKQFQSKIANGFAETVDGGIKFTIFGGANSIDIPIIMEVIHHETVPGTLYLCFNAPETFSIRVAKPSWDGTMEYSTDTETWNTWNGSEISGTALYLRGTGNTKVTGTDDVDYKWTLTGSNIACTGNIEALLDYETVANGEYPPMAKYYCYSNMFRDCTSLITAPDLPATTMESCCYYHMFDGCTSLTSAPNLPATTLAHHCYNSMFHGCTSLITAPDLPATTMEYCCYYHMFDGCTSLKLSATQTNDYTQAYQIPTSGEGTTETGALVNMFAGTGGTFAGTPEINTTYYLHKDCSIV